MVSFLINTTLATFPDASQLFGLYLIIALAFWAAPSDALDKVLALIH